MFAHNMLKMSVDDHWQSELPRQITWNQTLGCMSRVYLYLPDTPNTSRRVLRGVRAKMALIFSPNNQNITCKDVLIT